MVQPFQMEGMRVAHVPVGPDLLADPDALAALVGPVPSSWAVLHCETFGSAPSPGLTRTLGDLAARGAALVVDATHTWPLPPVTRAALPAGPPVTWLASVRKFAQLPDGALLIGAGAPWPRVGRGTVDEAETRAWIAGDIESAEDLMDAQLAPAAMSPESRNMLDGLDTGALVARHRVAASVLEGGLAALGLERVSPPGAHFCTAFRHVDGPALVEDLARAGVDGPVWWPRPTGWVRDWPDDLVTLPADSPVAAGRVLAALRDALGEARMSGRGPKPPLPTAGEETPPREVGATAAPPAPPIPAGALAPDGQVRVDTWLWATRQRKSRSQATAAARAGHVSVNGATAKSAQRVHVGDEIRLRVDGFDRVLRVVAPLVRRVGAPQARQAYIDLSPERPHVGAAALGIPVRERGSGRPSKKERRELDLLRGRDSHEHS